MYDKWWAVTGADAPSDNHPLWATRPDMETNTRSGSTTHRCKECHGWDYKGVNGVYGGNSHRTGFDGILGTQLSAQGIFDLLKGSHGYGDAGLSEGDLWDLTRFVLEGLVDTDTMVDGEGDFKGDVNQGSSHYTSGIGESVSCMGCHGAQGLSKPPFSSDGFDAWVGKIAVDNPWEFQHKVRFGQPGTVMQGTVGGTLQDVTDLGAYAQTLPVEVEQGALALNLE